MSEKEQIYDLTVKILVLGYSPEDALERAKHQVFVDDVIEDPVVADWSHLDKPLWTGYDTEEGKLRRIKDITWEIKLRENRK